MTTKAQREAARLLRTMHTISVIFDQHPGPRVAGFIGYHGGDVHARINSGHMFCCPEDTAHEAEAPYQRAGRAVIMPAEFASALVTWNVSPLQLWISKEAEITRRLRCRVDAKLGSLHSAKDGPEVSISWGSSGHRSASEALAAVTLYADWTKRIATAESLLAAVEVSNPAKAFSEIAEASNVFSDHFREWCKP